MGNGPRFAIVEARVTVLNRMKVQEFSRLAKISTERQLRPSEAKRFAFLQTRLMRSGAVVLLTKKLVTDQARAMYRALPWHMKLSLRLRYRLRVVFAWFALLRFWFRSHS